MYQTLLKPFAQDAKKFITDILFPITCLSCGEEGSFICPDCKSVLVKLEHQRCIVCQKPAVFGLTHSGCLTPQGADALISFFNYKDQKVADIIIAAKYKFVREAFNILGQNIAGKIRTDHANLLQTTSYQLTPIPLHPSRKRWRGFNQAEILCHEIAKELNLSIVSVLVRCKMTKTQKDLKKEERGKNILGAFALAKDADVKGKNFILVDDVTTTGATLQEAAKTLKRAGAAKVVCLTVARD